MEAIIDILSPDVSRRNPPSMRPRSVERTASDLCIRLDRAVAVGEPLVYEFPACLRVFDPAKRAASGF